MPNIEGYKLTNKGNALQIKVEAGKCKLDITKLKLGSGTASGDIVNLTDLVKVEQTVPISKIEVIDDYTCRITGLVTNQGLNKTYYIREIGLYAQDPDDGEILYLVAVDKNPDVMPADNYQMIISQEFNIDVVVSNVDSVNVTSQPVHLITDDELNKKIEEHNTSANPHENIFKRVLITEAKTAANTSDWNMLIESRTYKISGATFAADKHQPVGAVGTGELVVLKNGDDTIAQVYYANSAAYDKAGAYHRMCISGAWTDWVYNITNKGGNVTGDFNINGKLTVDSVQVNDRLMIGEIDPAHPDTSNFLTPEDLKKIQDQIIAPQQTIYVDQKNGNDNNDGTISNKAFRTLNKAIASIRQDIPTLAINLKTYTEEKDRMYNTFYLDEPINFSNTYQSPYRAIRVSKQFSISATWENYISNNIVAKIVAPYGKVSTGDKIDNTLLYAWGNILFIAPKCDLKFVAVNFAFPEDVQNDSKFTNTLFYQLVGSLEIQNIQGNTLQIPANCSLLNAYYGTTIDRVEFSQAGTITGEGILINARSGKLFSTDPKTTDGGKYIDSKTVGGLITKYIKDNSTTFSGSVLGDTSGLTDNTDAIYKKGFD
nr:MAG TPA: tail collar fiber protein [Caudoviricetes sp.]